MSSGAAIAPRPDSDSPPHYQLGQKLPQAGPGLVDRYGQPKTDHLGFVLSNPPLETGPPADSESHVLTIDRIISHNPKETGGGPYLVRCSLDSDPSPQYVAKIYDGLEYELSEADDHGCDCMYWADMHYSREAAAYENIPPRFQGDIVPRYFGAWTFSVPASVGTSTQQRPVRMILIEYIDGESMLQWILRAAGNNTRPTRDMIDYSLLPTDGERLEILGRTVEAELAVWWYGGVHHQDISPRNIMISRPPGSPVRVVLIDFDLSHVLKLSESGRRLLARRELGALPISPIERYWPGAKFTCGDGFNGWISESWCVDGDVSDELAREWLVARWKGSPRYQPLSGGFLAIAARGEVSDSHRRCLAILKAEADEVRQENDDNGTWRTE